MRPAEKFEAKSLPMRPTWPREFDMPVVHDMRNLNTLCKNNSTKSSKE